MTYRDSNATLDELEDARRDNATLRKENERLVNKIKRIRDDIAEYSEVVHKSPKCPLCGSSSYSMAFVPARSEMMWFRAKLTPAHMKMECSICRYHCRMMLPPNV